MRRRHWRKQTTRSGLMRLPSRFVHKSGAVIQQDKSLWWFYYVPGIGNSLDVGKMWFSPTEAAIAAEKALDAKESPDA